MKDLNEGGKKLLLLGGAFQHCKAVEAAHEMGVSVYVTDNLPIERSPAKQIADKSFMIDIFDIDGLVTLCKEERIDGVLMVCLDACQIPYQKLCEKLGFPCFGTAEQFQLLTNKRKFKECCKMYGVDTIPEYSIDQISNDIEIDYPVIVKPAYSRGSRGQTICYDKSSVGKAIDFAKSESFDGNAIIEKYMGSKNDFVVSYIVNNGDVYLTRSADRYLGTVEERMDRVGIATVSPSKHIDIYFQYAHEKIVQMIKGIGLINAPVFFQGFVDCNKVRLYDPGLRFAGGEYERFYQKAYNINLIKYLIEFALCGKMLSFKPTNIDCTAKLNGSIAINLLPAVRPCKINKIKGLEEIKNKKSVLAVFPKYKEGDIVEAHYNVNQRFAEIDVMADSAKKLKIEVDDVQTKLIILDSDNKDMTFVKFDTNIINQYK